MSLIMTQIRRVAHIVLPRSPPHPHLHRVTARTNLRQDCLSSLEEEVFSPNERAVRNFQKQSQILLQQQQQEQQQEEEEEETTTSNNEEPQATAGASNPSPSPMVSHPRPTSININIDIPTNPRNKETPYGDEEEHEEKEHPPTTSLTSNPPNTHDHSEYTSLHEYLYSPQLYLAASWNDVQIMCRAGNSAREKRRC
ncbi:hypothetical protein SMMN14_08689 [Sphaerulina musiva]